MRRHEKLMTWIKSVIGVSQLLCLWITTVFFWDYNRFSLSCSSDRMNQLVSSGMQNNKSHFEPKCFSHNEQESPPSENQETAELWLNCKLIITARFWRGGDALPSPCVSRLWQPASVVAETALKISCFRYEVRPQSISEVSVPFVDTTSSLADDRNIQGHIIIWNYDCTEHTTKS